MRCNNSQLTKGLSIVEVIVVSGIVAIFFSSLLSSFYYTVSLVQDSKVRQSALSVATNQIEYIRSLSYDAVGTVAGIPPGNIPQLATSTLNGITFTTKTLVEYVDDPADGLALEDANSITTDYKTAKVTVSWQWHGQTREVFMVSRIVPRSIETDVGGGTLRINVYDRSVQPLAGVSVQLVNNDISPAIDVTRLTNADGVALFGGAPAGAGYEVLVSKVGYSTTGTNPITTELVNPSTPPAAVAEADITTLNFFIDQVSSLAVKTISAASYEKQTEEFSTTTGIYSSSEVDISDGKLVLKGGNSTYVESGSALLQMITPTSVAGWEVVAVTGEIPPATTLKLQVYSSVNPPVLIPDTDLPGNSTGFLADVIDISSLNTTTYPELALGLIFTSGDPTMTPAVDKIVLSYLASVNILSNVSFTIQGNKSIGTRGDGTTVYKFLQTTSTNNAGVINFENMEEDTYTINPTGYTITEACGGHPVTINPATAVEVRLALVPAVAKALRVHVLSASGASVGAVEINLSRAGFSSTKETSPCGQVNFLSPGDFTDYVLTAKIDGVTVWSQTGLSVVGNDILMIQLP